MGKTKTTPDLASVGAPYTEPLERLKAMNKAQFRAKLVELGIYTPSGELTPKYSSPNRSNAKKKKALVD